MNKIVTSIIVGFALLFFVRRKSEKEEPAGFVDVENYMGPYFESDEVASFCPLNYSEFAGTTNFDINEFHSKDGTKVPKSIRGNVQLLMEQLEVIRAYFSGLPVIVNSGFRSIQHNQNVGGSDTSYHLCGMAGDIRIPGIPNDQVQEGIEHLMLTGQIINGGLGRYNNFTHYDIGPYRRWDKR